MIVVVCGEVVRCFRKVDEASVVEGGGVQGYLFLRLFCD